MILTYCTKDAQRCIDNIVISQNSRNKVKECFSIHEGERRGACFSSSVPSVCVKLKRLASNKAERVIDPSVGAECHPRRRRQHLTGEELASAVYPSEQGWVFFFVLFYFLLFIYLFI